jgi:DNA polymerase-4
VLKHSIDERQVNPDRIRKSVGAEDTFVEDINDFDVARSELKPFCEKVWRYCEVQGTSGKTVTVKIKYFDFTQATRSRTSAIPFACIIEVLDTAAGLLATVYPFRRSVRLLGVTLSALTIDSSRDTAAEEQPQFDLGLLRRRCSRTRKLTVIFRTAWSRFHRYRLPLP